MLSAKVAAILSRGRCVTCVAYVQPFAVEMANAFMSKLSAANTLNGQYYCNIYA